MTHWCDGQLVPFDLETDSPDPEDARLVSAAAVHVVPGRAPVTVSWLAQPERDIPAEATEVHGISTAYARMHGAPRQQVIPAVAAMLFGVWGYSCPLVGHNVSYDLTVLDRELGRVSGAFLPHGGPVVDTLLIDKRCDRFRKGSRKLVDQCTHYGVELNGAHEAAADALAAGRLAWRLGRRRWWPRGRYGPHATEVEARALLAEGDVVALHHAQVGWHEEDQRGFAEYLRSGRKIHDEIGRKVAAGELDAEEAAVERAELAARADAIEVSAAGGWPVAARRATERG